jgi:GH15 family glucan-1,4-alpha-glucosidase
LPWSELARSVAVEGAEVPISWEVRPGTRFASVRPWVHFRGGRPYVLSGELLASMVVEGLGEARAEDGAIRGDAVIQPGEPALLALMIASKVPLHLPHPDDVRNRLAHTIKSWRTWSDLIGYHGPHREAVVRSALVLKSLASRETGALVASPTTSLPEKLGGSRNYDYRFSWVRDASFMLDALSRLGLSEEVDASLGWLLKAVQKTAPDIRVFYDRAGEPATGVQHEVERWEGYRQSRPVTIGNKAAAQTQHGTYGDLFGAVSRYVSHGGRLDTETGLSMVKLADKLCDEWPLPGAGIWELEEERQYTSSLMNSWAALQRVCELAEGDEIPSIHVERWKETRDAIHRWTDEHCWSQSKASYTFYAGTDDLDASVLLAARTGFLVGDDPRLGSTIDAIKRELGAEGPFLYRYTGADKEENAFVCCTFWLIEAMCRAGRAAEAEPILQSALGYANDLGLWSEEIDASTGELLGNLPLGLSHLSVIGAITAFADATAH